MWATLLSGNAAHMGPDPFLAEPPLCLQLSRSLRRNRCSRNISGRRNHQFVPAAALIQPIEVWTGLAICSGISQASPFVVLSYSSSFLSALPQLPRSARKVKSIHAVLQIAEESHVGAAFGGPMLAIIAGMTCSSVGALPSASLPSDAYSI